MKSVMMRVASADARQAAVGAAHEAFQAGYGPLLEEREEAVSWAWQVFRELLADAEEELDYWLDFEDGDPERSAIRREAHDRKVAELEEKRERALADAWARFDAGLAPLVAARDAAIAAADAQLKAVWAASKEAEKEEEWKATLRRGHWSRRRDLVGKVPVDHPIFRRLLHDPDHDVRITAAAHEIALRSQSA